MGQSAPVLREMGSPRGKPRSGNSAQGRLYPPLLVSTQPEPVTHHNKLLILKGTSAWWRHCISFSTQMSLEQLKNIYGFYNRLFLVPKQKNRWRPIWDLSNLNQFLNTESFKPETTDILKTSLQTREWVTSIDFKDVYFHIHSKSCTFTPRAGPTNLKHFHLACPQPP